MADSKRILVVGENAIKMMTVGGGSSSLKVQHEVLPLEGLQELIGSKNANCKVDYARGYVGDTIQSYNGVTVGRSLYEMRPAAELRAEAVEKARGADYVIVVGGLNKSDFQDCEGHDRKDYALPYGQNELIEALLEVNPRLVFVNISGNAVAMPWADRVPAIVQGWYGGSEAGRSLADVLTGDSNPSGKLPFTWAAQLNDVPAHRLGAFPGTWRTDGKVIDEEYKEGLYVGYRGVDQYKTRPLFAFGHGLSYTTFRLGKARADKTSMTLTDSITFTLSVTNTGQRAGAEVVQLYVSDLKSSLPCPKKELKGFQKVFLQPGETREVSITIGRDALSFYDDRQKQWKVEPGAFEALIGTASDRIASNVRFTLK